MRNWVLNATTRLEVAGIVVKHLDVGMLTGVASPWTAAQGSKTRVSLSSLGQLQYNWQLHCLIFWITL